MGAGECTFETRNDLLAHHVIYFYGSLHQEKELANRVLFDYFT